MRKSLIAQSVAALIAGLGMVGGAHAIQTPGGATAEALVVNTDGVGHINIVPYYSAHAGNATNINIVNSDMVNGKALKVRFRGAGNSDDVFDFTLLMSPGDVFAFAVSGDGATAPKVTASDKTCTLPNNIGGRSFVLDRLSPKLSTAEKAAQASEGYVEILTMADIDMSHNLGTAIKHVNGVPLNCTTANAAIAALLTNVADETAAALKGLLPPTTGLFTNWTIINVENATTFSGAATAIEGRDSTGVAGAGNVVFFPQTAAKIVDMGYDVADYTSDPLIVGGSVVAASYDFPDLSTPYVTGSADPSDQAAEVSGALEVVAVANEFVTDPSIGARTDWVFSSPTRRYSAAVKYGAGNVADVAVFNAGLTTYYTADNTNLIGGKLCVENILPSVVGDREERFAEETGDFVISPGTPAEPESLCGEVSVLTFNNASPLLGASVANFDLQTGYTDGWVRLNTPGAAMGRGLPVIGYAAMEVVNGNVNGAVANYGLTFPHRVTRP